MKEPKFARYLSLEGQSVFITGGGSGIGATMVEAFAEQGARVAFVDIDEGSSRNLVARVGASAAVPPLFIRSDVTNTTDMTKALAGAASVNGDVTVLVNNAANDERHDWRAVTPDYWDRSMSLHLRPMFFAAQTVADGMCRAGGGSIINFGSISWKRGMSELPCYTTAKAAVHGLTRSLARALGPFNVRVNTVVPGWVMTAKQLEQRVDPEGERAMDAGQCLKDRIKPEDLARMVLFLASDDARMCTSQEFTVDAGWV